MLKDLVAKGNTVIVIEHDLNVIKAADYLIELGPKPSAGGGKLLFAGEPWKLYESKKMTPTAEYLRRGKVGNPS